MRARARGLAEHLGKRDKRSSEREPRSRRREETRPAARDALAANSDQRRRGQRREQRDPGGGIDRSHPRNVRSLSTSSASWRRPIATINPSPTTTSDAATAMTAIAKTWP